MDDFLLFQGKRRLRSSSRAGFEDLEVDRPESENQQKHFLTAGPGARPLVTPSTRAFPGLLLHTGPRLSLRIVAKAVLRVPLTENTLILVGRSPVMTPRFQAVCPSWPAALATAFGECPPSQRLPASKPCHPGVLMCTEPLLAVEQPLTIMSDILKIKSVLN